MSNPLIDGKTFEEIINQPYEMVTSLWLSSYNSDNLTINQIIQFIDKFEKEESTELYVNLIKNLIIFHINKIDKEKITFEDYSNLISRLLKLYHSNRTLYVLTIKCYRYDIFKSINDLFVFKAKREFIIFINTLAKFIDDIYHFAHLVKKCNNYISENINTEEENYNFTNVELTNFFQNWNLNHLFNHKFYDIFLYLQILTEVNYAIFDNKVIAYKGVEDDNTSVWSSSIKYQRYTSYSEVSDNDYSQPNSFGLSVWDFKHAQNYGKTILTVEIDPKDITYFDFTNGVLRCSKFVVIGLKQIEQ